ncbi:MAG TPA: tetratricopeptide repeat protein [Acidimicrobiales bacterium]|nr:tetratricopeptide repeat protein [Acidimicrobiales bacterium]
MSAESLAEERDHLLRSLEDLEREREAGDLEEADYLALRDDYTARAADVLRALESSSSSSEEAPAAGVTVAARPTRTLSPWRPALVVAALVAFAAGAGVLVARSAGERHVGDSVSGSVTATGASGDLARAQELIGEGKTLDAIKLYDAVLKQDPRQPEALAYRGWLLRLAGRAAGNNGLVEKGIQSIDAAVAADPSYPDAHFFRAFVLYQDRNDPAAAVPELRTFLASNPPKQMVPVVEDLLQKALADAGQPAPTTTAPPP